MSVAQLRGLVALAAATVVVALPLGAAANMADPTVRGEPLGEPSGDLAGLHIESEDLQLDLRPLADAGPVNVQATYRVRNDGAARAVDLVFVATALADAGASGVWLDGAPIPFERDSAVGGPNPPADVPWAPTQTTPGFDGRSISYAVSYNGTLRFTLNLAPGPHEIRVEYSADAAGNRGDVARLWQVGYVLAPARRWASFGTLNVLVHLPPDWLFASDPPLQRTDGEARGTFTGVPADSLALTTQFPVQTVGPMDKLATWLALGIAAALGIVLAAFFGSILGRRGPSGRSLLPLTLVYVTLAGIAVLMVGLIAPGAPPVPSSQAGSSYAAFGSSLVSGIGAVLTLVVIAIAFAVVLALVMQFVASIFARRSFRPRMA